MGVRISVLCAALILAAFSSVGFAQAPTATTPPGRGIGFSGQRFSSYATFRRSPSANSMRIAFRRMQDERSSRRRADDDRRRWAVTYEIRRRRVSAGRLRLRDMERRIRR